MMIPRQKPLSRRTVLRGAGVALGLPWLEAMVPSALASPSRPPPSLPCGWPCSTWPTASTRQQWTPEGQGRDFRLSPHCSHSRISRINCWSSAISGTRRPTPATATTRKKSSLLTCTTITKTLGVDINIHGPSMDQVAAQRVGGETPLPSLELGIEPESTGVDANVGYTRVYGCHIAWSGPTTPLARETNPRSVYSRLFRAAAPAGNSAKQDTQLLDRVLRAIQDRCAPDWAPPIRRGSMSTSRSSDRSRRGWSGRATRSEPGSRWCPLDSAPEPAEVRRAIRNTVRLMLDLIALAFQSDTTRISTFMFGNAVSGVNFRFLEGVTDSHHEISHHSNNAEKLRQYARDQSLARGPVRIPSAQTARYEGRRTVGAG